MVKLDLGGWLGNREATEPTRLDPHADRITAAEVLRDFGWDEQTLQEARGFGFPQKTLSRPTGRGGTSVTYSRALIVTWVEGLQTFTAKRLPRKPVA